MLLPDGCATSQGRSTAGVGVVRNGRNADENVTTASTCYSFKSKSTSLNQTNGLSIHVSVTLESKINDVKQQVSSD
jgi:hypothetical protein